MAIFVALIFTVMLETLVAAWMSAIMGEVTNALVAMDQDAFYSVLASFGRAVAVELPLLCTIEALCGTFAIEWRRVVTKRLLEMYISRSHAFYRMKCSDGEIDNPDQRIGQDIAEFTLNVMILLVTVMGSAMRVAIMSRILISISPNLYVYLVVGALVSTVAFVKVFGGPLMRLTRLILAQEATLRFALIRVREHAESIAFFRGAPFELVRCKEIVQAVLRTYYRRLAAWVAFMGGQKVVITAAQFLPFLLLGPSVLRGETTVGAITQTNMLFGLLLASLTSVISDLQVIASLGAQSIRIEQLRGMLEGMEKAPATARSVIELRELPEEWTRPVNGDGDAGLYLRLDAVTLWPPRCEAPTVHRVSLQLHAGESLLLCGESGVGKSSLLRAVAGLWAEGEGSISRAPMEETFFLPQQPYLCLGTLRENLEYPKPPAAVTSSDAERTQAIVSALNDLHVGYLVDRHGLDTEVDFESVLSGGEQQRIGFARLLLRSGVKLAILDEATSAMDSRNEELAYKLLAERVRSFVSVGHRVTLERFHSHKLLLEKRAVGGATGVLQRLRCA